MERTVSVARRPGSALGRAAGLSAPALTLARPLILALTLSLALLATPALAQRDFSKVEIQTTSVAPGVWMLVGAGGNIGVSAGDDGVLLIDDQFAPLTEKIRAAVRKISPKPIRFVLNTHWHGDHTGGNENLAKDGALILANEHVRERMSKEQFLAAFNRKVPPSPPAALPVITYDSSITFHLNGDEIYAFHPPPAHTDGDSIVQFKRADVVHMGDIFFNGRYPFVDLSSGGSAQGVLDATNRALELMDDHTKVIPGHGPLATKADLVAYRDMLRTVLGRVKRLIAEGKTLDEIQAAKPTADLDAKWGGGFISPASFVATVYQSLTGKK